MASVIPVEIPATPPSTPVVVPYRRPGRPYAVGIQEALTNRFVLGEWGEEVQRAVDVARIAVAIAGGSEADVEAARRGAWLKILDNPDRHVVSKPDDPQPPFAVNRPDFEHFRGPLNTARTAIGGLFWFISSGGRRAHQQRAQRQIQVNRRVGDRLADVKGTGGPGSQVGWNGYMAPMVRDSTRTDTYEGDFTHMGEWLLKRKIIPKIPNTLRPTTWRERRAAAYMDRERDKRDKARSIAAGVEEDYGERLRNQGALSLSNQDRKVLRKAGHLAERNERRQNKAGRRLNNRRYSMGRYGRRLHRRAGL